MKKIVPDPPSSPSKTFGTCQSSHPPLFSVRADVHAEDALVHAVLLLRGIHDTVDHYCQHLAEEPGRGMLWSVMHSAETAKALVEGLLDSMTAKAVS
ncbi:hypothetical protein DCO48_16045 [Pseudomonas sp. SDI]|uniref:DUF6124 family protein n=1 Tax=Pseudomonas sp. SDI TaxID=2170734 RepID=UPI000DE754B9|nr:hypothetical protein [Pseudomonas sp. SDI]PWB31734.1 hypothetical protein DCO48_16045 [Pseudomonas sp. SDI]